MLYFTAWPVIGLVLLDKEMTRRTGVPEALTSLFQIVSEAKN
jgi:hypothetical protein